MIPLLEASQVLQLNLEEMTQRAPSSPAAAWRSQPWAIPRSRSSALIPASRSSSQRWSKPNRSRPSLTEIR